MYANTVGWHKKKSEMKRKTSDFKLFVNSGGGVGGCQQYWRHQMAQIKYACYAYIKLIGLIGAIRNGCSRVRPLCGAEIFRRFCSFFNRFNVIIQITFSHLIKIKIMNLWLILFILINLQYTYVWINFNYILKDIAYVNVSRFKSFDFLL